MSLDERLRNLVATGSLKNAIRDEALIRQFVSNAEELRRDAEKVTSSLARFNLAYEGLHALAMAFLNHHGVRTGEAEGHRNVALQLAVGELTRETGPANSVEAVILMHKSRNETTYFKPIPPVSRKLADAAVKLLEASLGNAPNMLAVGPPSES